MPGQGARASAKIIIQDGNIGFQDIYKQNAAYKRPRPLSLLRAELRRASIHFDSRPKGAHSTPPQQLLQWAQQDRSPSRAYATGAFNCYRCPFASAQ